MLFEQRSEVGADGNAPARTFNDPLDQITLPPARVRRAHAMLREDEANAIAPVERQRQNSGVQTGMRVNQIGSTVFVNISFGQFHAAAAPDQRVAVWQSGQSGECVAAVDRQTIAFDCHLIPRAPSNAPGPQITPSVNCWRQYRDPISGGFERQGLIAKIAATRAAAIRIPRRNDQDMPGQATGCSLPCSARCSAKTLLATIIDSRMIGTPT